MPKSHLAPERPTARDAAASASRSVLPIGAESSGRFAIWYVVRIDGNTAVARFPFNMREDAERYSAIVGGCYVVQGRASVVPSVHANPPATPARRKPEPPASVRVLRLGEQPRSIPCDNRQEAINLATRIADNALQQNGGILTRNGNVLTVEWKYLPGGVDGTGRRFAERAAGSLTVTVCERGEQPALTGSIHPAAGQTPGAILTQRYRGVHFKTRVQTWEEEPTETPYADRGFALAVAEQLARGCMERTGGKMSRKYDTWTVEYGFNGDTIFTVSVS